MDEQYLSFTLGDALYAIPIANVREVLCLPKVTRLPRMGEFMKGVIDLRGKALPVLDLGLRLGLAEVPVTDDTAVIVLETEISGGDGARDIRKAGVTVDAVNKVITLKTGEIDRAPKFGNSLDPSFIRDMGAIDGTFVAILEIREILAETGSDGQISPFSDVK
jgi:purine-binding chemotaxis protein CheW